MKKSGLTGIIILITLSILLGLVLNARAAGQVRLPSRWLPGDAAISPAYGDQSAPAIARGNVTMLAAWSDARSYAGGPSYEFETSYDIYGILLDANGGPLSADPFPIASGPGSQTNPKVSWNGANYLVMFESVGLSGTGYYYEKSLAFVRVSANGVVLDPVPVALTNVAPTAIYMWALASDGSNWVVAFQGTSATNDTMAVRISPNGEILDAADKWLVRETYYMRSNMKLAYAGGVFLLTYNDDYNNLSLDNTRGVRFDQNLNRLDAAPILLLDRPISDLTSNGSEFYAVWNQQLADYSMALYGSRINASGQKLDGSGDNISASYPPAGSTAGVIWDGMNWRAVWQNGGVRAARISASGVVLDPGGVAVSGPSMGKAAPAPNGGIQLIWSYYNNQNNGIQAANISSNHIAGPTRDLDLAAPAQVRGDAATNGTGYMVVYNSITGTSIRVLAQPLDASGNPLGSEPIQLDSGDTIYGPGPASVAWNGSVYLVAWNNSQGIVGQRLDANGNKLDAAPFVIMSGYGATDVEAVGDTFLVVGRITTSYSPEFISAIARRVSSSGTVLGSVINLGGGYVRVVKVTHLGGKWLAVYHSNWSHNESGAGTAAVFVNPDGTLGASTGLINFSTAGGNGWFDIGLTSNGSKALVVQSAEVTSGVETDLLGFLLNPDGSFQPATNLTPWSGNQYRPRAAWDGTNFIVLYNDQRNRLAEQSLEQIDARGDIYGMRIKPDGTIVDPQGFLFSNSPVSEANPNLAAQNGVSLMLASFVRNETGLMNYRIGYEQLGSAGNQWPVARVAASPAGGNIPLNVSFSSTGSTDPDGTIASYLWDFGDGGTSNQANPTHLYTAKGPFLAVLTVTDNAGAQTSNAILVKALQANQAPVAHIDAVPSFGPAPLDVTLYARGSYDPDGSIGNFEWSFSDGASYYGATAYHTFSTNGNHTVTLKAIDAYGAIGSTTLTISVGTKTATPTRTAVVTGTRTMTPVISRTPTPTPTRTSLPNTATLTRTATLPIPLTSTPTQTLTPSVTLTFTTTPTASSTATPTPTGTPVVVPTITPTTTQTPFIVTRTPTMTATVTKTVTPTATVTVLPVTFRAQSVAAHDGWILESTEGSNRGGSLNASATTFQLGDDAQDRQYRGILSFNTSGLPDNAIIQSVTLRIKRSGLPVGEEPFKILGNLLVDIRKGAFGAANLAAEDFQATPSAKGVGTFSGTPALGWHSATLNLTGQKNINKTGFTQFRLYFSKDDNDNLGADYMRFVSGNGGAASRPQLIITYTLP